MVYIVDNEYANSIYVIKSNELFQLLKRKFIWNFKL